MRELFDFRLSKLSQHTLAKPCGWWPVSYICVSPEWTPKHSAFSSFPSPCLMIQITMSSFFGNQVPYADALNHRADCQAYLDYNIDDQAVRPQPLEMLLWVKILIQVFRYLSLASIEMSRCAVIHICSYQVPYLSEMAALKIQHISREW